MVHAVDNWDCVESGSVAFTHTIIASIPGAFSSREEYVLACDILTGYANSARALVQRIVITGEYFRRPTFYLPVVPVPVIGTGGDVADQVPVVLHVQPFPF
jgi:hypothetical protein